MTEPTTIAMAPIQLRRVVIGIISIEKRGSKTKNITRTRTYAATLVVVAAIKALTAEGASEYAPGSQACIGNNAILMEIPITKKANPTSTALD